jgi:FKBP-type peptidyl-prolyl cis-trans isomerase FklB
MFVVVLVWVGMIMMSAFAASKSTKPKIEPPPVKAKPLPKVTEQKPELLPVDMNMVSYAIGARLGQNFKQQDIEIKIESFVRGLKDALTGGKLELTQQQIQQLMTSFSQQIMAKQQEKRKAEAAKNLAAGKAFLEANKSKEGVKVLPSGLQYKILREGTGKSPTAEDKVKTHYSGKLIDGAEFDSSYKRNEPAEFAVKGVIKGWTEALQLMKEGAKWELYIPPELAYGERGNRNIPGNSTLIFEVELLEIVK